MKIELTDKEIKTAVANYVSATLGLDLVNNDLAIVFSATRYEGLIGKLETTPKVLGRREASQETADAVANLEPRVIPGYSDTTAVDAPAPADLTADPADTAAEAQADATLGNAVEEAATLVPTAEAGDDTAPADVAPETAEVAAPVADAPKKPATLFGKPASTVAA